MEQAIFPLKFPFLIDTFSAAVRQPMKNDSMQQDYASFSNKDQRDEDLGLNSDDLEAVAVLYDCIRELFKEQDPNKDAVLADQFDEHVKHVMQDLTNKLNSKESKNVMQTNVLKVLISMIFSNSSWPQLNNAG